MLEFTEQDHSEADVLAILTYVRFGTLDPQADQLVKLTAAPDPTL